MRDGGAIPPPSNHAGGAVPRALTWFLTIREKGGPGPVQARARRARFAAGSELQGPSQVSHAA